MVPLITLLSIFLNNTLEFLTVPEGATGLGVGEAGRDSSEGRQGCEGGWKAKKRGGTTLWTGMRTGEVQSEVGEREVDAGLRKGTKRNSSIAMNDR